jgi:hypothetical protein
MIGAPTGRHTTDLYERPHSMRSTFAAALAATTCFIVPAHAADAPVAWADTLKLSGHIEAGITYNPDDPANGLNFGQLFTDRANRPLLNQILLTAERPLDPKATGWDFGFKLQGMYGSDARYLHFFNEFDRVTHSRNQWDVVEANVVIHAPVATEGGIDLKVGQYSTPLGAEVIDAAANTFYSHSYIFNFGLPFKHTGLLSTTHVNDTLDLWAGVDTGVNASIGKKGDNNGALAGIAGIGLNNLMDGKLTILALAHIGPENPRGVPGANSDLRYIGDVVVTYKVSDELTSTTEFNYIHDDHFKATGGGVATYLTYTLSDQWSVAGRAEVFRDANNFFVAAFPGSLDFVNAERGLPATVLSPARATTYGALTIGATYKPPVPKAIEGFAIRPELRYDQALTNTRPFNSFTSRHQFTAAVDFILPF